MRNPVHGGILCRRRQQRVVTRHDDIAKPLRMNAGDDRGAGTTGAGAGAAVGEGGSEGRGDDEVVGTLRRAKRGRSRNREIH
jgi:hypothetical protein